MSYSAGSQSAPVAASGKGKVYFDSTLLRLMAIMPDGRIAALEDSFLPNYLRNSGFWFAQRQTPGSASNVGSTTLRSGVVAGTGGCDAWGAWNENANTTYARTDTMTTPESNLQGRFYGSFAKVTSTGKFFISQMLEGHESGALRGRTVRWQCWMKGTGAQTCRLGFVQLNTSGTIDTLPGTFISAAGANSTDPTLGTNLAYVAPKSGITGDNCSANGNAYDCSVTTSWQRFGGVFDVPSNAKNLLVGVWTNSQLAAASGFSMAQASLTDGYEIQNWAPMDFNREYARVARHFYKTFNVDTLPAQSVGTNTGELLMASPVGAAAATGLAHRFPVPMRAAAGTLTLFNPSAANAQVRDETQAADCSGSTIATAGEQGCYVSTTSNASTAAGHKLGVHFIVDASGANNEFA